MSIPSHITTPKTPRFIFAPDHNAMELYIICTSPLALLWVRQTVPAQIYILEGPQEESLLLAAGEWYKENSVKFLDKN